MTLPDEMIKTAIVGTVRQRGETASTVQDRMVPAFTTEGQLLLGAATHALQQRASFVPVVTDDPLPPTAPEETRAVCSTRAMYYLDLMLGGLYTDLLPEWFKEVAAIDARVPEESIYRLLEQAKRQTNLEASIFSVIGERGRWLSAQMGTKSSDAARVTETPDPQELTNSIREAIATRDNSKDQALQIVSDVWASIEGSDDVEGLLADLHQRLEHEYETFLEWLMEVKRYRKVAAQRLMRLPGARFMRDMKASTARILSLKRVGRSGRWSINFVWSEARDRDTQNESRTRVANNFMVSDIKWEPRDMLELITPGAWCRRWEITPENLIEAGRNSANPYIFFTSWIEATINFNDVDFALALLQHKRLPDLRNEARERMAALLTSDQREQVAIKWLETTRPSFDEHHPAVPILKTQQETWSEPLMTAFLTTLEHSFQHMVRPLLKPTRRLLRTFAPYFPITMKDELRRVLSLSQRGQLSDTEQEIINEFIGLIDFRMEMLDAIRNRGDV